MRTIFFSLILILSSAKISSYIEPIRCQGQADGHLQGFDSDGQYIYWSMYSNLIKTDFSGKVIAEIPVTPHHGDCCVHEGKVYCASELRRGEKRGNFITIYNCDDLSSVADIPIDFGNDGSGGIDGIAFFDGHFYIGEGKKKDSEQEFNWIHKFTTDFRFVEKIKIPGKTFYGIQAMTYADGYFWLGTYSPERTYQCDQKLNILAYHDVDISVGAFGLPRSPDGNIRLMVARNIAVDKDRKVWSADCLPAILINGKLEWEIKEVPGN